MRILFTTTRGAGHFGPLIPFAHACRRAGHQVLVAGEDGAASLAADAGLRFHPVAARAALPGMAAAIEEWCPDVVVRAGSEAAALIAAERLGVPHARVEIALLTHFAPRDEPCLTLAPASLDLGASHAVRRFRDPVAAWAPALWGEWGDPEAPLLFLSLESEPASAALAQLAGLPLRVLVTTGGRDPELLGPLGETVRVERWVAQAAALRDAAVMVGHGDAGSVLGALAAGVPMALLPQFADQPFNAGRIDALGAGIALGGVDELRDAVARLLAYPAYADRARRLRDEIQALPSVDEAVGVLTDLADGDAIAA